MELSKSEVRQAVGLGLTEAEATEAKAAGLSLTEARMAKGLGLSLEEYAASRSEEPPSQEWREAEQAAMMAGLAGAAMNANTEAGERLRAWASDGVPPEAPLAWWSASGFRDAAYARAKRLAGADGVHRLGMAESENIRLHAEGKRPTAVIPEDLR